MSSKNDASIKIGRVRKSDVEGGEIRTSKTSDSYNDVSREIDDAIETKIRGGLIEEFNDPNQAADQILEIITLVKEVYSKNNIYNVDDETIVAKVVDVTNKHPSI